MLTLTLALTLTLTLTLTLPLTLTQTLALTLPLALALALTLTRRVPAPHARGSLRPPPLRGAAEWSLPRKKHVGGISIWADRVRMNIPSPSPAWRTEGGRREYSYQLQLACIWGKSRVLSAQRRPRALRVRRPRPVALLLFILDF